MKEEQLEEKLVEILKAKNNLTEEIEKIEHEFDGDNIVQQNCG